MAGRKRTEAKAEVKTVTTSDREEPSISDGLVEAREKSREADAQRDYKDARGALLAGSEPDIEISSELIEAREKALEAERNRKTF